MHRNTVDSCGALDMSYGILGQGFLVCRGQLIQGMAPVGLLGPRRPLPVPKDDCWLPQPCLALSGSLLEGGNTGHAGSGIGLSLSLVLGPALGGS